MLSSTKRSNVEFVIVKPTFEYPLLVKPVSRDFKKSGEYPSAIVWNRLIAPWHFLSNGLLRLAEAWCMYRNFKTQKLHSTHDGHGSVDLNNGAQRNKNISFLLIYLWFFKCKVYAFVSYNLENWQRINLHPLCMVWF